jgi:hypothetical protein
MGTRADFYVGKGCDAEWIGSVGNDGFRPHPGGKPAGVGVALLHATTERNFRRALADLTTEIEDHVTPDRGWPWPWNDSRTSDCSYWFFDGGVWDVHCKFESCGPVWVPCSSPEPKNGHGFESVMFPDMSKVRNVTGGWRSILPMPLGPQAMRGWH